MGRPFDQATAAFESSRFQNCPQSPRESLGSPLECCIRSPMRILQLQFSKPGNLRRVTLLPRALASAVVAWTPFWDLKRGGTGPVDAHASGFGCGRHCQWTAVVRAPAAPPVTCPRVRTSESGGGHAAQAGHSRGLGLVQSPSASRVVERGKHKLSLPHVGSGAQRAQR